ncbi:hypothetical protein JCGZ_21392 [Jatropha curcas]|uniref:Carboxypeptidase n=1 Tax=Jatropha curcas TaxID=180498 RepID=A0A067JAT1_JATCU|nr:hypothetical protein JCGZ_21392 [Jatropha curcas]
MDFVSQMTIFLILVLVAVNSVESVVSARDQPLVGQKQLNPLDNDHLVTNLPGQPAGVNFSHYAGYVTVNEKNGRALFYWFFEATTRPDEKPLMLWLNGGPGSSSVGYGPTQEIGPFLVDSDGLKYNPYSWNTANDSYAFLHKWFVKFSSYRNRTLYIAGESYAGKYIPELAQLIQDNNKDPSLHIDLRGILMGNPETSDPEDWAGIVDYAWSHAIISDETHKIIKQSCDFYNNDTWSNRDCSQSVDEIFKQYNEIDIYSLYSPTCTRNSASSDVKHMQVSFKRTSKSKMMPRFMGGYDPCLDDYARSFYNRPDVQKALHCGDGHLLKNWSICNDTIFKEWKDSKPSVLPIYKKLIAAGIRIWVYSGDTDGRVPVLSTRYSIASLGLNVTKAWRPWYHQKQVGGWYQEYEGLTFATFRGAGHDVPTFQPSKSLAFFSAYIQGKSPPSSRNETVLV